MKYIQLSSFLERSYRDNVLLIMFNSLEPNVEPFPTFDLEINKEDKDKDIDNPVIKKDPRIEKNEEEEPQTDKS